jgi:hypothetical protein
VQEEKEEKPESVCSGELNFNLRRVIRALRAASGNCFHLGKRRRAASGKVAREINNFC